MYMEERMMAMHASAHATCQLILEQIEREGVDKTIGEMRDAMKGNTKTPPTNQMIWKGFIALMKDMSSAVCRCPRCKEEKEVKGDIPTDLDIPDKI